MKDIFHQALFLFIVLIVITGFRLVLGDYIRFLGTTDILLYLIIDGVLLIIVVILYILSRNNK
jgi:NADH:ubiquinone oxidoreductase subunit 6 (subunit J)